MAAGIDSFGPGKGLSGHLVILAIVCLQALAGVLSETVSIRLLRPEQGWQDSQIERTPTESKEQQNEREEAELEAKLLCHHNL